MRNLQYKKRGREGKRQVQKWEESTETAGRRKRRRNNIERRETKGYREEEATGKRKTDRKRG